MRKNYFYFLFVLGLLLMACNDDLQITDGPLENPSTELEGDQTDPELEAFSVHFEDVVFNDDNQKLAAVVVSIYANNVRYTGLTDVSGRYKISVPADQLPQEGFISMSISHEDYKPKNLTYKAPLSVGESYDSDLPVLALTACPDCLIVGDDKSSELYHLGDDEYGGAINSQFQKATDGLEMSFKVEGADNFSQMRLSFEAKGLQPDYAPGPGAFVFVNDGGGEETIFLETSPEDGSYSRYTMTINNRPVVETITFKTNNYDITGGNYDDWEFTCLHVEAIR